MGVKAQDIYDLMDRFEAGSATRLKLNWDGVELELEKGGATAPVAPQIMPVAVPAMAGAVAPAPIAAPAVAPAAPTAAEAAPALPVFEPGMTTLSRNLTAKVRINPQAKAKVKAKPNDQDADKPRIMLPIANP